MSSVVGEEITFFCKDCKKHIFTTVPPNSNITCPCCGFKPDIKLKSKAVTHSQSGRLKRADEFFKVGGEADKYLIDAAQRYSDGISSKLSITEKREFYHRVYKFGRTLDKVGDYIIAGKSEIKPGCKAYSTDGLNRKKSGGKYRIAFYNQLNYLHIDDTETPDEIVERKSFSKGYTEPFKDQSVAEFEYMEAVTDPIDKQIVYMLA